MEVKVLEKQHLVEHWRSEYEQKGIPSSFRAGPSSSVVEFASFLASHNIRHGSVLDLGCGRGRNSVFLAERGFDVSSIDFVPDLIEMLQQQRTVLGLSERIHAYCQSVTEPWPFPPQMFDSVIDTFCYKHLVIEADKAVYRRELARVMKSGSFYLLTLAGLDDGYYGPLLASSPAPDERMIIDPVSAIPSILYTKEDVISAYADAFDLVHYTHKLREGMMHGAVYQRSTLVFIFSRH
jgi:SAM-dependent methyltransferase